MENNDSADASALDLTGIAPRNDPDFIIWRKYRMSVHDIIPEEYRPSNPTKYTASFKRHVMKAVIASKSLEKLALAVKKTCNERRQRNKNANRKLTIKDLEVIRKTPGLVATRADLAATGADNNPNAIEENESEEGTAPPHLAGDAANSAAPVLNSGLDAPDETESEDTTSRPHLPALPAGQAAIVAGSHLDALEETESEEATSRPLLSALSADHAASSDGKILNASEAAESEDGKTSPSLAAAETSSAGGVPANPPTVAGDGESDALDSSLPPTHANVGRKMSKATPGKK